MANGKPYVFLTSEQMDAAVAAYLTGTSCRELARQHNTDKGVFMRELKRRGIPQRNPGDRNRLYPFNEHAFDAIDNEQAAYWLGFIYADGCLYKRSLGFGVKATDAEHLGRFTAFIGSECPVKLSTVTVRGVQHDVATLCITHQHMTERLHELGIVKGRTDFGATKRAVPPALLSHWVRGIFDGDGHVGGPPPRFSLVGSHELVAFVHDALIRGASVNPNVHLYQHCSGIWYIRLTGRPQCLRIADYLYRDATVWLPRKRNCFESWVAPLPRLRDGQGRYT